MQSNLILTTAQAQAVYSAMCALNAVGARLTTEFPNAGLQVYQMDDASIAVQRDPDLTVEDYDDLAAFAAAYGLREAPDVTALLNEAESAARRIDWFLDMNPDHVDSTLNVIRQDLRTAIAGGHR